MSLGAAQFNLGRVVGPALAGLVITAGGLAWAFGLNVVSFGAVLVALSLVRIPPLVRSDGPPARVLRTIADGVVAARRDAGHPNRPAAPAGHHLPRLAVHRAGPGRGHQGVRAGRARHRGPGHRPGGRGGAGGPGRGPAGGQAGPAAAAGRGPAAGRAGGRPLRAGPHLPAGRGRDRPARLRLPGRALGHQHRLPAAGPARAAGPHRQPVHARGRGRARPRPGRAGLAGRPGRAAGRHRRHRAAAAGHRGRGAGDPSRPAGGDGAVPVRGCPSAPAGGRPGPGRPG